MFRKRLIPLTILGLLLSSLLLSACDGTARVNVDVDPDTGEGTIDIVGGGDTGDGGEDRDEADTSGETSNGDQGGVQNAIIFATVVALLLGVTAIVVSLANRSRHQA